MAYSATLANVCGLLSDEENIRLLNLYFEQGCRWTTTNLTKKFLKGTKAILRTTDGKLRAAVPSPLGSLAFLNDISMEDLYAALHGHHKRILKRYPHQGGGLKCT